MKSPARYSPLAIKAASLACIRDQHEIFAHVDFEVKSGEVLFVRGPNGSGKSSLLMILAGILPTAGQLDFGRTQKEQDQVPTSELMHFIAHLNAMKSQLTLGENLGFWASMFGSEQTSIPDALAKAGLAGLDNFLTGHLSTGQKHRLSLARLLINPRPVWLLDEPSSALDDAGDQWVASLIENHLANGGLVVAATHRPIGLDPSIAAKTLLLGSRQTGARP